MPSTPLEELDSFTRYVQERIDNGGSGLSLDMLYQEWRLENPTDKQFEENVAAVQVAINDMKNGDRGRPAGEVIEELQSELGISPSDSE